jgi:AraC-like DNA-binding protein
MTMMEKQQQKEEEEKKKDRRVRIVSLRLSERDYERHLSMAKICHENGLTKGPDIVS